MEICANLKVKPLRLEDQIPFLKWAGGKRWLARYHFEKSILPETFTNYIEPFAGSAAMFFAVKPSKGVLNDLNKDLIDTYKALKSDWYTVFKWLEEHHSYHDKDYYYDVRDFIPKDRSEAAARFIYLNRTCFNGLYRVNREGRFNVPVGTKTNVILETDNFFAISKLLRGIQLTNFDFSEVVSNAKKGDFLFVDPPYTTKSNSTPYVKYNQDFFSWDDQKRLRDLLVAANSRGVKFLMTNIHDDSIRKLYWGTGFTKKPVDRSMYFSSKAKTRGNYTEYLIKNY